MRAELLVLQEVKHRGRQCLGNAVDLVDEEDALPATLLLHRIVDGCDDLAHGVPGDGVFRTAVLPRLDHWEPDGGLAGVVRDSVSDVDLGHDGRLAEPRGSYEHEGPLPAARDDVVPGRVFAQIRYDCALHVVFGGLDIHDDDSKAEEHQICSRPPRSPCISLMTSSGRAPFRITWGLPSSSMILQSTP